MNKTELVRAASEITGFTQKDVGKVVDAINESKVAGLKKDGIVKDGLFTYKTKVTNARMGRNPKTGEPIQIKSKTKVVAKSSKVEELIK